MVINIRRGDSGSQGLWCYMCRASYHLQDEGVVVIVGRLRIRPHGLASDVCCGVCLWLSFDFHTLQSSILNFYPSSPQLIINPQIMSLKPISPLRRIWFRWKALRLPWRKKFLVGAFSHSSSSPSHLLPFSSFIHSLTNVSTSAPPSLYSGQ